MFIATSLLKRIVVSAFLFFAITSPTGIYASRTNSSSSLPTVSAETRTALMVAKDLPKVNPLPTEVSNVLANLKTASLDLEIPFGIPAAVTTEAPANLNVMGADEEDAKPVEEEIADVSRKNKPRYKIGIELFAQYKSYLDELEGKYGVDADVIMGIWGIETHYGQNFGRVPVREALLAYGRQRPDRRAFVNGELAAANRLIAKGIVNPQHMVGSYAGAMGHTQFIPTSFEKFAVDGDGDGKINLWTPKDALASTANYLSKHGWKEDEPWGFEINAPAGVFKKPGASARQPMSFWLESGVKAKHEGTALPTSGHARLQRYKGRNYLLFDNFFVIMTYNHSTEYAYQVASLGDQVVYPERAGVNEIALSINGPDVGANWGTGGGGKGGGGGGAPKACTSETCKVQQSLKRMGYYSGPIDGSNGPQLQKAIVKFQVANRLPADGRITKTLTRKLH